LGERAVLLEQEKPPRQLDHAAPHPRVARARASREAALSSCRMYSRTHRILREKCGCDHRCSTDCPLCTVVDRTLHPFRRIRKEAKCRQVARSASSLHRSEQPLSTHCLPDP
jgi:hypothetical protein